MVALCLTACGEESKEKNNDKAVKTTYKLYAIDGFTGEYDINELLLFSAIYSNGKAYTFDEQNRIYIDYQSLPIFKTEVLKQIITPEKTMSKKSQHLENYRYLLGENASFDGKVLKYTLGTGDDSKPLSLTWGYIEKDVSGLPILEDTNNPIHRINQSPNSQIFATTIGIGYLENEVFPQGATCWQKISAQTNQAYIEYYPERIIRHVAEDREKLRTEGWNDIEWTEFKLYENDLGLANVKIVQNGKVYWGSHHPIYERIESNKLACDLMNDIAYNAAIPGLNKYREILEKDNLDPNLLDVIWWPGYLERVELNPYLPET